jgi:hypothetical protein
MESKILIDINYASREPQIVIHQKDSDDPRDKLVSMFTGGSMPGVRDGYCRIERYPEMNGDAKVVITPVHPEELVNHIPTIAKLAEENNSYNTAEVFGKYLRIIENEYERLMTGGAHSAEGVYVTSEKWILAEMNRMCEASLDPERFDMWESVREELTLRRGALKKDVSQKYEPKSKEEIISPDNWAQQNLSHDLYRKWQKDVFGQEYKLKSE